MNELDYIDVIKLKNLYWRECTQSTYKISKSKNIGKKASSNTIKGGLKLISKVFLTRRN